MSGQVSCSACYRPDADLCKGSRGLNALGAANVKRCTQGAEHLLQCCRPLLRLIMCGRILWLLRAKSCNCDGAHCSVSAAMQTVCKSPCHQVTSGVCALSMLRQTAGLQEAASRLLYSKQPRGLALHVMHSTVLCRVAVCTMRAFPLVLTLASTVLQTL